MNNYQLTINNYPFYKDSGVEWLGDVPEHWKVVRAKDICKVFVPQRDKPELNFKKGIPWITSDLLGNTQIDSTKLKYLVDEEEIKFKKIRKVPANSVLASCIGEFSLTAINPFTVIINQQIQAYSYIKLQSLEFINYQIQANVTKFYYETVATETTIKYINKEKFSFTPLYLPPLSEQKAIADYLDTKTAQIDRKIDLLSQKAKLYSDLKQSLINETVTRGLDKSVTIKDSGIEWIGEVPQHWEFGRAKALFRKEARSIFPDDDIVTVFRDGKVTLRKNRRITGFTIALHEHGYQGIRKGDLVIHAMDAFAGAVGVSDSDGKGSPVYSVYTPVDFNKIYTPYYGFLLRQMALSGFINSLAKGIRERSTEFRPD